ncbi:7032_t:CDS:1, partial [Funneliformis geosporum]
KLISHFNKGLFDFHSNTSIMYKKIIEKLVSDVINQEKYVKKNKKCRVFKDMLQDAIL